MSYYCYMLFSTVNNRTYIGMTVDPNRRLRQHNGELVGGAKATSTHRPWSFYCIIKGFVTLHDALSFEWNFKHPDRKKRIPTKYKGINGRINGILHVLKLRNYEHPLTVYICDPEKITEIISNITFSDINQI